MSRRTWYRVGLAVIVGGALVVGLWAQLAPRSFFDDFPGWGRAWVIVDGPYNEHLVRDVGGLNLALALVALIAMARPTPLLVATAAGAALVFGAPHLLYHLVNLQGLDGPDRAGIIASLGVAVIVPVALLVGVWSDRLSRTPPGQWPPRPGPAPPDAAG